MTEQHQSVDQVGTDETGTSGDYEDGANKKTERKDDSEIAHKRIDGTIRSNLISKPLASEKKNSSKILNSPKILFLSALGSNLTGGYLVSLE